jgi:solanesyl diphosphate synthase
MHSKAEMASFVGQLVQKVRKAAFFLEDIRPAPVNTISSNAPASWNLGLRIIEPDMEKMTRNIVDMLVGTIVQPTHPLLAKIASYYFELKGKRLRPAVVLLISHALNTPAPTPLDKPVNTSSKPGQLQLAEIVEMIHTASLVHDDVIDDALTRRDMPSANARFGNKMAIMAGDFLLARASISLARLQNCEVTELMASALGDLIEGEFMQMRGGGAFDQYIQKTYLKTASLLANGCRCAAILSGATRDIVDVSTEYGKNLGLAFQVVDDLLDFTGSTEELGKPAAVDLSLGLATAPVLYAREEFPELEELISRKFSSEGDVAHARSLVERSNGIEKTKKLAAHYSQLAVQALKPLPASPARDALIALPEILLGRTR